MKAFPKAPQTVTRIAQSTIDTRENGFMIHPAHANSQADRERGIRQLTDLNCVLPLAEQAYLEIKMPMPNEGA